MPISHLWARRPSVSLPTLAPALLISSQLRPSQNMGGAKFGSALRFPFNKPNWPGKKKKSRSSSREVRIRVPDSFSAVYFTRGTLPPKSAKGHYWGT